MVRIVESAFAVSSAALIVGKSSGTRIVPVALILAANSAAVAAAFSAATFSA